jgi:hypothetical protein
MMEQEFFAHPALIPYPPPMDHSYFDEVTKQQAENPADYSSADGSDN